MMKSIGTGVASLIAYGCILDNAGAVSINQQEAGEQAEPYPLGLAQTGAEYRSLNSSTGLPVTFDNETDQLVELFWLNFQGNEVSYGTIAPGASKGMYTYATHPWIARGKNNAAVQLHLDGDDTFVPEDGDQGRIIHIDEADVYRSYGGAAVPVTFKNESSQAIELFWHNYQGELRSYGQIAAGATMAMNTYATHPWSAIGVQDAGVDMSVNNASVYVPVVGDAHKTIVIEEFESKSSSSGLITLTFDNESGQDVELFWHNYNGDEVSYGRIADGQTKVQGTYATHPWTVVGLSDASAQLVLDGDDIFVPTS